MIEITNVPFKGEAANWGLQKGDAIVSINGHDIIDSIDLAYYAADERLLLVIQSKNGIKKRLIIRKGPDEGLGLEFAPFRIKQCRNNCIFCFVDQMPAGCRKTLYVKDDDFRASFLYGNFITLAALSESDWERIFRLRLSPLYISVHTTDPGLRTSMVRNKNLPDIMESLRRLAAGRIKMHTQIVVCPGVNDGEKLLKTITDLASLFPAVSSIAAVPVGLTAFRKGLFPLRTFTVREAREVLELIEPMARRYKRTFGTRLVFASDEFYINARATIPPRSFYEDFPQIENGVGMVAQFLSEVSRIRLPSSLPKVTATLVTGVSFGKILKSAVERLRQIEGVKLKLVTVKNGFFGPSVTVAGLLSGSDILSALKGKKLGDLVLIPANMLKDGEDILIDDTSLETLERNMKVKIVKVGGFRELIAALRGRGRSQ